MKLIFPITIIVLLAIMLYGALQPVKGNAPRPTSECSGMPKQAWEHCMSQREPS